MEFIDKVVLSINWENFSFGLAEEKEIYYDNFLDYYPEGIDYEGTLQEDTKNYLKGEIEKLLLSSGNYWYLSGERVIGINKTTENSEFTKENSDIPKDYCISLSKLINFLLDNHIPWKGNKVNFQYKHKEGTIYIEKNSIYLFVFGEKLKKFAI
jgi:hypothetical protein